MRNIRNEYFRNCQEIIIILIIKKSYSLRDVEEKFFNLRGKEF